MGAVKEVTIICKEINPSTGTVSVSKIVDNPTSELCGELKLREQLNPALQYFAVLSENWVRYGKYIACMIESGADLELKNGGIITGF